LGNPSPSARSDATEALFNYGRPYWDTLVPMPHLLRSGELEVSAEATLFASEPSARPFALVSFDDAWLSASDPQSAAVLCAAGEAVGVEMCAAVDAAGGALAVGSVVQTTGGGTGATAILHVVTRDWAGRRALTAEQFGALILRTLDIAASAGHVSLRVASPPGLDPKEVQAGWAAALRAHFRQPSPISSIILVDPGEHLRPMRRLVTPATHHAGEPSSPITLASVNPQAPATSAIPVPFAPVGATPASRLASILLDVWSQDARVHILGALERQGYRGEDADRVTELVLQEGHREVLVRHTDAFTRSRLATGRAGLQDDDPDDGSATDAILAWCGYRVIPPARGLVTFHSEFLNFQRLAVLEPSTSPDRVVAVGRLLEELLKQLIRFCCGAFWQRSSADVAPAEGWCASGELEGLGLGALIRVTRLLDQRLRCDPNDPICSRFRTWYADRPLLPGPLRVLSRVRNSSTHHGRRLHVRDVPAFFAEAEALFDHLEQGSPPLFPSVIVVRARREDAGGILWEATDENGLPERLHTDESLTVGVRYFMVPKSNPIRAFPLLVEV
jgi:hypothetical protein